MRFKISLKALNDIENIWVYTFINWSQKQADRYQDMILNEIEYLAENPETGKDFKTIRTDYRYSKVKSHLIFYRYLNPENTIEIIRVLHQQMDINTNLGQ